MTTRVVTLGLLVALCLAAPPALAAGSGTDEELFERARAALGRGAPTEAIENLELLADRGTVRANASFNRAMAYIARAESSGAKPGDLGRAVAALSEAIALGDDAPATEQLLEQVREEIARRRVRQGSAPIAVSTGLGWAVVGLVSENAWAIGAASGALLLTLGLALWLFGGSLSRRVPAALLIGIGAFTLVSSGVLTGLARHRRLTFAPAVVVAPDTRLTDLAGRGPSPDAGGHDEVPEGASVELLERRGHRARIAWDGSSGWVPSETVLALPRR